MNSQQNAQIYIIKAFLIRATRWTTEESGFDSRQRQGFAVLHRLWGPPNLETAGGCFLRILFSLYYQEYEPKKGEKNGQCGLSEEKRNACWCKILVRNPGQNSPIGRVRRGLVSSGSGWGPVIVSLSRNTLIH
jgi:hypothetical protein